MELTFLPFYKQLVLLELYKNSPHVSDMFLFGKGVDKDVIDVCNDVLSKRIPEDIIYEALEHCRCTR